jgi:chaperonin cofactor prefoldin
MKTAAVIKRVTTEFLYDFLREEFEKINERVDRLENGQHILREDLKSTNQRIDQMQNTLLTMQNTLLQTVQILIEQKARSSKE